MCAFFAKLLNVPTEPRGKEFREPVFLLGAMRSGTTLLMNTLSEHPQLIKVGFELSDVWSNFGGAPIIGECLERTESDLTAEYRNNMTAYFTDYIFRAQSILRHLSRISQRSFYGSGGVFYDWENVHALNKNPHLSNKVRYLNGMFPKSKYIIIVRSPLGQSASMKMFFLKQYQKEGSYRYLPNEIGDSWQKVKKEDSKKYEAQRLFPSNVELLVEAWLNLNYTMFKHLEMVPKNQQVVIAYEDLMNERPNSIKRIFEVLDLENKHNKSIQKIISKERKIHNTSTSGNPLFKWKKHLNENEQEVIFKFLEREKDKLDFIKSKVPNSENLWVTK